MKVLKQIKVIILISALALTSCSGNNNNIQSNDANNSKVLKGSNVVGDWYHAKSQYIGGYRISANTKLTIARNGPGDYDYYLEIKVIDAMYGGQPKTNYSTGKISKKVIDEKWSFIGGDYGDRGGYIEVPSDLWDGYKPSEISIQFGSGRGSAMTFKRTRSKSIQTTMKHRCGRTWNGELDRTYGVYGDYCCERCYVDFYPN